MHNGLQREWIRAAQESVYKARDARVMLRDPILARHYFALALMYHRLIARTFVRTVPA